MFTTFKMFTTGAKVVLDTHASQSGLPLLTGARADTIETRNN